MFHGKKQKKGGWSNWVSHHCAILCHKLPGATCQVLAEASIDFSRCSVVAPETRSSESGRVCGSGICWGSEGGFLEKMMCFCCRKLQLLKKNPKILPLSYCGLVLRYLCAFRRNDCCLFFDWKQGQTKPIHLGYLADWKVWLMAPFGILLMWDADVPVQTCHSLAVWVSLEFWGNQSLNLPSSNQTRQWEIPEWNEGF